MEIIFDAREAQKATLVFLHGFGMCAEDMALELAPIAAQIPWLRIVVPQAPAVPVTAYGGDEYRSWFDYLTDKEGETEDAVDTATVRSARNLIQKLLWREERCAPAGSLIIIGGLSQGGCLALDMATRDTHIAAVVTAVSHRLHLSRARPILCPWYALSAEHDEIFPSSWAAPIEEDDAILTVAAGADHYLSGGELVPFVTKSVQDILLTSALTAKVADDEEEKKPEELPLLLETTM